MPTIRPPHIILLTIFLATTALAEMNELLPNPHFQQGLKHWHPRNATILNDTTPGNDPTVRIAPAPDEPGTWSHIGLTLIDPPIEQWLEFTTHLRGEAGQTLMINTFAYNASDENIFSKSHDMVLETAEWEKHTVSVALPKKTTRFTLWIINRTDRELLVSKTSLVADVEAPVLPVAPTRLHGPGVLTASAATHIAPSHTPKTGQVLFPIPAHTAHQVPLDFVVHVEPPENLRGVRWIERPDGRNLLAEVTVASSDTRTEIRWTGRVLVANTPPLELPPVTAPEENHENRSWLYATACVQSDDTDVVAKADSLAAANSDFMDYVLAVTEYVKNNRGDGARFKTLDAAAAIHCGGSCTSRANLCAALLRANGIAARTQAHLPIWSGALYEHWLVEYWHPSVGWVWLESSLGKLQPETCSLVTLNTANTDDEDQAFDEILGHSGVMAGAPRWSVHELSPELDRAFMTAGNWATVACALSEEDPRLDELFRRARARFAVLSTSWQSGRSPGNDTAHLNDAITTGTVKALLDYLDEGKAATD